MIGKNTILVLAITGAVVLGVVSLCYVLFVKTGIVDLPGSRVLYHPPASIRLVHSRLMNANAFQEMLSARVRSAMAARPSPPYAISLTEEEIGGVLQSVIGEALRSEEWKAASLNVAITPDFFEVSGRFVAGKIHADIRVRFVPIVENGGVRLEPVDIRVGEYPIHPSLARRVAGALFRRDFGTWMLRFGDIQFRSVQLRDGAIRLMITM